MKQSLSYLMLTVILSCNTFVSQAQSLGNTTGQIDIDGRTRLSGATNSGSRIYDRSLIVNSSFGHSVSGTFYGMYRYGAAAVQQASLEKDWGEQRAQAGVVRLPFGIYDLRETYASGLIGYPLARSDYGYHSVDWAVPGAYWSGGSPTLQIEAAGFSGMGTSLWDSRNSIGGAAARLQTYTGNLIIGASRWDGYASEVPGRDASQPVHVNGLDMRYTCSHLVVRGEYIFGTLEGDSMSGSYLDFYYRLPNMEKWTAVARVETLKPGDDDPRGNQLTLGARYVATREWTIAVNWRKNNLNEAYDSAWTSYSGSNGDVTFQIYRKIDF